MTLGIVLIFIGIQLNLVETYVLTPRFSNLLTENVSQFEAQPGTRSITQNANNSAYNSPYYQASYPRVFAKRQPISVAPNGMGVPKTVSTPTWLCWPVLFLGTVVFLHGLSVRRD